VATSIPRYYAGYYNVNGKAVYLTAQQAQQQNVGAGNFLDTKAGGIKLAQTQIGSSGGSTGGSNTGFFGALLHVVTHPFSNSGITSGTGETDAKSPIGPAGPSADKIQDDAGGVVKSVADSIGSTLDFLKFIAWIFHPRNILRAVEFLTGIALIFFGGRIALSSAGVSLDGFSSNQVGISQAGLSRVNKAVLRSVREDKLAE
jgi:hypothetical protein